MLHLSPLQSKWVAYVRENVAPRIGPRRAAVVTWWALKEGILNLENPWRHNLCSRDGKNVKVGDLEVCPGTAWQLGMSGIQGNEVNAATVEAMAGKLYPGTSIPALLERIADTAQVRDDVKQAVMVTTNVELRKAWLLRDPAIGFALQAPFVESGCVTGEHSWCYGGWDTAKAFAANKSVALNTIAELEALFGGTPSAPSSFPWLAGLVFLGVAAYFVRSGRFS